MRLSGGIVALGVAALMLQAAPAGAAPATRDLCPDRPGKGTPACILDAGRLQLEVGLADAARDRQGGTTTWNEAYGAFELRYGLTRTADLHLSASPWLVERTQGAARRSGAGDVVLAVRQALTDPDGAGVQFALQPFVSAPAATHGFGAGGWQGGVIAAVAVPLSGGTSLGLSPELDVVRDAGGGGTHLAWGGAAGVSWGFGPAALGAELWARRDEDPAGSGAQASFDLSAAWTLGEDLQLDAGANAGLTHATPDAEVYLGVSRRF
ncbi:transporter [Phenylobacterium sp.]|uniref:transporter n=1 Tax=Phenylobacterium sp. TaxID=1871053 RepID=UPI002F408271